MVAKVEIGSGGIGETGVDGLALARGVLLGSAEPLVESPMFPPLLPQMSRVVEVASSEKEYFRSSFTLKPLEVETEVVETQPVEPSEEGGRTDCPFPGCFC